MSGQLVGEVLTARAGHLADLSQAQTLALVAIAEKCHADSRQGSVRLSHIQAAIGRSQRTAVRTLEQLKDRGLIRVTKRGYKSHGTARASIYELSVLTPPKMAQPTGDAYATQNGATNVGAYATQDGATNAHVLTPNPNVLAPNGDVVAPPMDGVLDGSIDGSIDGGPPAAPPGPPAGAPAFVRGPYGPRCRRHAHLEHPPSECTRCHELAEAVA